MALNLRLANGINPFRTSSTPLRHSFRSFKCSSRFNHAASRNRYPSNSENQKSMTSAPFNAKEKRFTKKPFDSGNFESNFVPPKKPYITPEIIIYHNPSSIQSLRAKKILEDAQTAFPRTKMKMGPPLSLKLVVHERLPTVDEVADIYFSLEDQSWAKFLTLDATYRTHATNAASVLEIVQKYREHRIANFQEGTEVPVDIPHESKKSADEDDDNHTNPLLDVEPAVLPPTHPLFGTECLAWPIILWESEYAQLAPSPKTVNKRLYKYSRRRDHLLSPEEREAAKEEAKERALRERGEAMLRNREVSPEEEDTLKWYNESSTRPNPRYPRQ